MTSDKIQETTNGLGQVNEVLGKYVREQGLSFEEKRELWLFYKEHEDTNDLIDCAVAMAGKDLGLLLSDAQQKRTSCSSQTPYHRSGCSPTSRWASCSRRFSRMPTA